MDGLFTREAVADMIVAGKRLLLAGDEALLGALPRGDWIGGTSPYFMTSSGGIKTSEQVFVTELPENAMVRIRRYDVASLSGVATDHPGHGFTVLLIPAFSHVHHEYAQNVAHYPGIFDRPVVGWISGVALEDIGKVKPRVFEGTTATGSAQHAVAMHIAVPPQDRVHVNIINLFEPGGGDAISFETSGFSVTDALINGKPTNFSRYLTAQGIDTRLPLVADYHGAMINVSIRNLDAAGGVVDFYAPVFPGLIYRTAAPIGDYVAEFAAEVDPRGPPPAFSCNCILNYVYAGLEGRLTEPLHGPMTFGEIAYILVNQTAVYLRVGNEV
jgi:hypothetical protein